MKLTITKENLVKALKLTSGALKNRSTLPVLDCFHIESKKGRFIVTASNLDITITCEVPAAVSKEGAVCVSSGRLLGVAQTAVAMELSLDVNDKNVCEVRDGKARFAINGLPAEDFPPKQGALKGKTFTFPQKTLANGLANTVFAVSTDESRYIMNGIHFEGTKEDDLNFVSTDGRRLAMVTENLALCGECAFTVPTDAVNALKALLGTDGDCEITHTDNALAVNFTSGDATVSFWAKLLEGNYPNYRQVIPRETNIELEMPSQEIVKLIERALYFTSEKSNSVKLRLAKNTLTVTANAPECGDCELSMDVKHKGEEMAIAFAPKYLLDAFRHAGETATFRLIDDLSPGVILNKEGFMCVVMPMRLA